MDRFNPGNEAQHGSQEPPSASDIHLMQTIMNTQEYCLLFTALSQEKRDEVSSILSSSIDDVLSTNIPENSFSATASQILRIMMTPAAESLPILKDLTQELKPIMHTDVHPDNYAQHSIPQTLKEEMNKSPISIAINPVKDVISFHEDLFEADLFGESKAAVRIVTSMQDQYNTAVRRAQGNKAKFDLSDILNGSYGVHGSYSNASPERFMPRLRVFLVPQMKERSRNFDYVGGTITDDPNSEYFIFCRGRPNVVPFAIGIEDIWQKDAKLRVQVIYSRIANKVPIRCSKHKDGDDTAWRDQLIVSTDPRALSLSYQEGNGFMIQPVPNRVDILFMCRNSCRSGAEKDWQLLFSLMDNEDTAITTRVMNLRVCEVPHRDMKRSKVKFEWDPNSTALHPKMRISPLKEEEAPTKSVPIVPTDVFPIYVSGYDSYSEIMRYVKSVELRKQQENLTMRQAAEYMRDWNRTTPILRFLQPVCGVETSLILHKFGRNDIHTIGDLYNKFTPEFFISMQISPVLASQLNAIYLNWRNTTDGR